MRSLLVIFSISLCSFSLFGQDYKPMLSDGNEWQFLTCFQGNCAVIDLYFTDGDTLVNNKTHKILDGYHYISRSFLLREVVEDKQVFLTTIVNGVMREYLLYDFSLSVGDEMDMKNPYSPFPEDGGMFTLTDIVELPLENGELYKHYYFSPSPGNTQSDWRAVWIEGVGSLSLVTAPGGEPNYDEVGAVTCSFANGEHIYANYERISGCDEQLDVAMNSPSSPIDYVVEKYSIDFKNASDVEKITIYDLHGRLVSSEENDHQERFSMPTAHLKKDMYIIIARDTFQHKTIFKVILH